MPLSRRHFVEFADFMVNLWSGKAVLQIKIENAINKKLENIEYNQDLSEISCKSLGIDKIIEEKLLENFNNIGKEIQLILDKNSLRFNKYMFKNYIIAKSEQNDTKIKIINH